DKARFENERARFRALQAQQQEEFDKERAQFAIERNRLMIDQAIIRNQLELALNRETSIREITITRKQQGMGYEQFATEVPTFACHFATKLEEIYRMLGGQPGQEAP
ncbi:hypothetical protein HAX54_009515, partial [Datura stramonium]|nr:hypothetical protein [Datura stramonium]